MTSFLLAAGAAAALLTQDAGPTPAADQAPQESAEAVFSEPARRVAGWIMASGDNRGLPYIIVDKQAARASLFDGMGGPVAQGPVLIGMAIGDEATPGIGSKALERIGPSERTTPAGRFLARIGHAVGGSEVLWVDYATSVALHTIPAATRKVRTRAMLSRSLKDNRITYGCINVPKAFYHKAVRTTFAKKGGYVYVLPDSKPLEDVFPLLRMQQPEIRPIP